MKLLPLSPSPLTYKVTERQWKTSNQECTSDRLPSPLWLFVCFDLFVCFLLFVWFLGVFVCFFVLTFQFSGGFPGNQSKNKDSVDRMRDSQGTGFPCGNGRLPVPLQESPVTKNLVVSGLCPCGAPWWLSIELQNPDLYLV